MPKILVGRTYRFRATHSLPEYPEPWCFPHQHDYTVEVVAEGNTDTLSIDLAWSAYEIEQFQSDMNLGFSPSTVENIAASILKMLSKTSPYIRKVTVWEDQARWGSAEN